MMKKKLLNIVLIIGAVGILGSGTAFTSAYLISGDKEVNSFRRDWYCCWRNHVLYD